GSLSDIGIASRSHGGKQAGLRPAPLLVPINGFARLRLRAVTAFDDEEIGGRMRPPQSNELLVFGRAAAGERSGMILEFDHHVACAQAPFDCFRGPAAHDEARTMFSEYLTVRLNVGLICLRVA